MNEVLRQHTKSEVRIETHSNLGMQGQSLHPDVRSVLLDLL